MIVSAHFPMGASIWTFRSIGLILRVTTHKKQVGDLILNEVVSSMVSDSVFMSKHHFAAIIFAMVMTEVFDFAALEAAAFTGIKMKHIGLPGILGHPLPDHFGEQHRSVLLLLLLRKLLRWGQTSRGSKKSTCR